MSTDTGIIAGVGLADARKKSRWPARLDGLQSASGLLLVLFMCLHMFFVSSILLGKDVFWTICRMFEGLFFFGQPHPWMVSVIVAGVIALLVLHALLAVRKFPSSYRQHKIFRDHMGMMHHSDTTLWMWQVYTGFALFFLATPHLYIMLTKPEMIGPYESADRVWSDLMWPLYIVLLLAVELHGGIGLYRLFMKWGWFIGKDPASTRRRLQTVKWCITAFFLTLGFLSLAAYIKIGIGHESNYGERYVPAEYRDHDYFKNLLNRHNPAPSANSAEGQP